MIPANNKSLFWTAVFIPVVLLFIASQIAGDNGILAIRDASRTALNLFTVNRPRVTRAAVWKDDPSRDVTRFPPQTQLENIVGIDPPGKNLFVIVSVGVESQMAEEAGEESLGDIAGEDEYIPPSTFLCRIDLQTGRIEWLTQNEYLGGLSRPRTLDPTLHVLGWLSVPAPELDPEGRPIDSVSRRPRSFWKYTPAEGKSLVYSDPGLRNGLLLSPRGECAVYVWSENYRLRSRRIHPPTDSAWDGVIDARIEYLPSDCKTAIGTILFPRLGPFGYTELVEYDFSNGELASALDQAGVRSILPKSLRAVSDDAFLVRCNSKARIDEPVSLISLYRPRPIRHILDAPGLAAFATQDPKTVMILDSSENILFRDRDPLPEEGRPILRFIDLESEAFTTVDSAALIPEAQGTIRFDHVRTVWGTNVQTSPLAHDNSTILIPNETGKTPAYAIDLASNKADPIKLDHPVNSFLWSPSGRLLALSSTPVRRKNGNKGNSEIGLTRTEVILEDAEVAGDQNHEADSDGDFAPNTPRISVWDREAKAVVQSIEFQGVPVKWRQDARLVLLRTQTEEPVEPGDQTDLLSVYSLQGKRPPKVMGYR